MKKGSLVLLGALSVWSCETARPKTPPTYGGAASEGLYEKGGSGVLPFLIQETSTDPTYGFTETNPVRVGGGKEAGVRNQQRYLNALLGPKGQLIAYQHEGNCCSFKIEGGGVDNQGQLDVYTIAWKGQKEPMKLYLNMYEEGPLAAPVGLSAAR
ncbi:hypothetical protein [Hymenobacter negativus]|uniref:2-dehydro-3-deoxyphosphooctonate aldolase n=1 Tax=Hymenobacter negativus TaxID=2795026 RepID=A0ABS0Q2X7_9BACT|nr:MULTISPECIES: hypothetical protein [Bacteria]MBH8557029.1 hypothetical protein [Hymenobacter negativus]MBH8569270.1 hypothetical protein [Hymenobacter negativus]MBR7209005.1 hypothetical protein [Microvirga sp. STS02]